MSEIKTGNPAEVNPERIPSEKEVLWLFKGVIGELPYTETAKHEDEQGLVDWQIQVEDAAGMKEYSYRRKTQQRAEAEGDITATIDATYYDTDGMPSGGESLAILVSGEWGATPQRTEVTYKESPKIETESKSFEQLSALFDITDIALQELGRDAASNNLNILSEEFAKTNKSGPSRMRFTWNPEGDLTEEEFNQLELRRKKLSNAIGMLAESGLEHDRNKI